MLGRAPRSPPGSAADTASAVGGRREGQILASLNHPNIAAILGLEEADGITARAVSRWCRRQDSNLYSLAGRGF